VRPGRRLPLLACALAIAVALAGCGGDSAPAPSTTGAAAGGGTKGDAPATAGVTTTLRPPRHAGRPAPAGERCQAQLGGFLSSMDALRARLAVGVTYEQYVDEIDAVRDTYRKIPSRELAIDCLGAAGAPGERAFNRYIDAANSWGGCIAEAGCDSAAIEPVLQRKWRVASHLLEEAEAGLRQVNG
jgi:hypothetical protein